MKLKGTECKDQNNFECLLSDDELDIASGGKKSSSPVSKRCDDRCDQYVHRSGGAGGAYEKFYSGGTCCETCFYFFTSSASKTIDPDYNGNGYCFYGL